MPWSRATSRIASALPWRYVNGPAGRPVYTPSRTSLRLPMPPSKCRTCASISAISCEAAVDDEYGPPCVLVLPGHTQHLVIETWEHAGERIRHEPLHVHHALAGD